MKTPLLGISTVAFLIAACSDGANPGDGDASGGSATASGGQNGSGSASGGQGQGSGGAPENVQDANFTVKVTEAEIATVALVDWSVDKAIDSAYVEFGRADTVEYTAPVDLSEPDFRTMLLGMKQGETYTLRIVATGPDATYVSSDFTFEAGYISNNLPSVSMSESIAGASYGGFTVSCNGVGGAAPGQDTAASWAFIFDKDGDYVWGYDLVGTTAEGCSAARMSHDGKYLWAGNFNNAGSNTPNGGLLRVSMDGSRITTYTSEATAGDNIQVANIEFRHHHFTVLPTGNILYQQRKDGEDSSPDEIRELDIKAGSSTLLYDETNLTGISQYHTNYVNYIPALNAFSFSMRHSNTIVLAKYPSAEIIGIFNGDLDEFGLSWVAQHGHQFIDGSLLVFNNASPAKFLEFTYELEPKSSGPIDEYVGGPASIAFGDVRRLPNGNTFITYSNSGVLHELNASKQLVKTFETDPLGYSEHRIDLYGPPPHLE